ncbi:hypothetical protein BsWGS_23921 [Bradybaena similaris]
MVGGRMQDWHPLLSELTLLLLFDRNLAHNSLTEIRNHTLAGLRSITQLYLTGNRINFLQPGAFLDLGQLTTLDLSNQNLSRLEANTFLGLHGLHLL